MASVFVFSAIDRATSPSSFRAHPCAVRSVDIQTVQSVPAAASDRKQERRMNYNRLILGNRASACRAPSNKYKTSLIVSLNYFFSQKMPENGVRALLAALFVASALATGPADDGFTPDNVFSRGSLGYGPLLVDSKSTSLFVGARGRLYRLWLFNVNQTGNENMFLERRLETPAEEMQECLAENSAADCETWIRLMFVASDDQLLLCTASGMKPQLRRVNIDKLDDDGYPRTVIGVCSPQAGLNTTAVFVRDGNPDGIASLYSGIRTGLTLENFLVYRPPLEFNNRKVHSALMTDYTDSKWLNEPQFVGSFASDQHVYFFFRELAMEASSCGRVMYSRVARVCKKDVGGQIVLAQKWTSFVKARLNCSLSSGQFPFYFDHIQAIEPVTIGSDTLIYATFSTAESPFVASAVCAFSLSSIDRLFENGVFLESHSNGAWAPTIPDAVPSYRPGTCVPNSQTIPDTDLSFARSHNLMADAVSAGQPLIVDGRRQFGKIVSDVRDEDTVVLYVLLPVERRLIKVLHSKNSQNGRLLADYALPYSDAVNSLAILPNEFLFIADDHRVAQYRLAQCSLHADCTSCATDPHCSWHVARAECFAQQVAHATAVGWITNAKSAERCAAYVKSVSRTLYPGDSTLLECPVPEGLWTLDKAAINGDSEHIKLTRSGGLVVLNATESESGIYQCLLNDIPVVDYVVHVDTEECTRPSTIEQFQSIQREWCRKLDAYKSNMSKWQRWYDNNSHCPRLGPGEFVTAVNPKSAAVAGF